jgi:hypothetical protein
MITLTAKMHNTPAYDDCTDSKNISTSPVNRLQKRKAYLLAMLTGSALTTAGSDCAGSGCGGVLDSDSFGGMAAALLPEEEPVGGRPALDGNPDARLAAAALDAAEDGLV